MTAYGGMVPRILNLTEKSIFIPKRRFSVPAVRIAGDMTPDRLRLHKQKYLGVLKICTCE
jgi:hypothetical protein